MNFSNITLGLDALTQKSIRELQNDMENYKLLEIEPKEFLIYFCRPNILSSLFINQIIGLGPKAIYDFQENIFKYTKEYLKELINIEDATFSYNPEIFPLIISISVSDMVLCNIDIFNKKIEILENFYFKDILEAVQNLNDEKVLLEKEFDKFYNYAQNPYLYKNKENSTLKNMDIMLSSLKKNNKYKAKYENECILIKEKIMQIDMELEEYFLIENTLRKNMIHVSYYQNRISERICKHLKYTIIKN